MDEYPTKRADAISPGSSRDQPASGSSAASRRIGVEEISAIVVDVAFQIHREIGPGLLESVYEAVLAKRLQDRGLRVTRQVSVPIRIDGIALDEGFRVDLLVEETFLVELKSVEALAPVHPKQLRTYLRLMGLPVGLVINFGAALLKEGVRRVVNDHRDFTGSRLRVNREQEND